MDIENDKMTIKQSGLWKRASKDLRDFCKKIYCLGCYNTPFWYHDKDFGMPNYDLSSISITDESFFQKYINFFMTELKPKNVLPAGGANEYACFYPDLNQILGEKTHILHDDLTDPWCVCLEKPYLFSKIFFELLSKYVVEHLNKVSMFEVEVEKMEGIPCLVTSAEIKRICNAEQFFEWVNSHNDLMKQKERNISVYDNMPGESIEDFDLQAEWKGNDSELKKLPLFVDIYKNEWDDGFGGYNYKGEVKYQMKVSIDNDSIIHINLNNREVCKNYYDKVRSAMNNVHFSRWIDGVLYQAVYDDLEYYVQYLIDNKYEQNNTRFINIIHWNELKPFDSLSVEDIYQMQCCILVGVEQI